MEFTGFDDSQLLAVIEAALDSLTDDRLRLPTDKQQLDELSVILRLCGRMQVLAQERSAETEQTRAAWNEHGTSTSTWLAESKNLTRAEASRLVKAGQDLARFPIIGAAAKTGQMLPGQATATTQVLRELPQDLDAEAVARGEAHLVELAASHNASELRRLSRHLLEVVCPETADELEAERLERQLRRAKSRRFLEFVGDGEGSVLIRASLPVADAEPLIRIVDAYAESARRGIDRLDPHAEHVTPAMRRADALVEMSQQHASLGLAPISGGERARITVTMSYDKLVKQARDAGIIDYSPELAPSDQGTGPPGIGAKLTDTGVPIAPSVIRQLLCDADILPIVLGGESQPLDVGRTRRLVSPAIRAALETRDQGCIFPGCDRPPQLCHAHHIVPWWAGGATALPNLVLVCPHHHGIIEPSHAPRRRPLECAHPARRYPADHSAAPSGPQQKTTSSRPVPDQERIHRSPNAQLGNRRS